MSSGESDPKGGAASGTSSANGWYWPAQGSNVNDFGGPTNHPGIDIGAPEGSPIWAATSGTVTFAGPAQGFGQAIIITMPNGLQTVYGHMPDQGGIMVHVGDHISAGTQIGIVGHNGNATGPHLHFEIRDANGKSISPDSYLVGAKTPTGGSYVTGGGGYNDVHGVGAGAAEAANAMGTGTGSGPAPDQSTDQYIQQQFGYAAAFFNTDPDLKRTVDQAVQGGWSQERFLAALAGTTWYKTHSQAQRDWQALWSGDNATARQKLATQQQNVQSIAANMGVQLDAATAAAIANTAETFGLSPESIHRAIAAHYHYQSSQPGQQTSTGDAAGLQEQFKQTAAAYGVNVSDQTLTGFIQNALTNNASQGEAVAGFTEWAKQQAKSAFPGLSQQIDAGQTVKQVADPYIQSMSSLLEVSPDSLTLSDPSIRRALAYRDPAAKPDAPPVVQPIWQFEDQVRQDPRWDKTTNAQQAAVKLATEIGKSWGVYAG